jgi:alpha-1,3-glucosyltransferase
MRRRQVSNASVASTSALHKSALLRSRPQTTSSSQQALGTQYIRFMHKWNLKSLVIPLSVAFATLLKLCIGMGSYSGEKTPPMYGDYEAQRHWMELTVHLPFRQWYTYDLQYWGLDYPPLTAYVSWICGIV